MHFQADQYIYIIALLFLHKGVLKISNKKKTANAVFSYCLEYYYKSFLLIKAFKNTSAEPTFVAKGIL